MCPAAIKRWMISLSGQTMGGGGRCHNEEREGEDRGEVDMRGGGGAMGVTGVLVLDRSVLDFVLLRRERNTSE